MNLFIFSFLFIIIFFLLALVFYSPIISESFSSNGRLCNSCSHKSFNQCIDCLDCVFCIDSSGNSSCIPGTLNGPNNPNIKCSRLYTSDSFHFKY